MRPAAEILRQAGRFVSACRGPRVVKQTACLRPLSPDGLPILGAAPGLSGAFIATGHGRAGLLLAAHIPADLRLSPRPLRHAHIAGESPVHRT